MRTAAAVMDRDSWQARTDVIVVAGWTFSTLSDMSPARMHSREVMVRHSTRGAVWWLRERIMRRLRRWAR